MTQHILTQSGETFYWNNGEEGPITNLSIKLSKQDADELEKDVKLFLDKSLPKVIRKTVKDGAKLVVKSLEGRWPEERIDERNQMQLFRDRLNLRWSAGLDPLRMMLIASREVGQEFADKLARSKAKTGLLRRQAITMLHMRACQTTLEILTLLESGLPDGAYARWRTLYEISVFALVIDRFGDEIADRYLAHDIVSMREALVNEFRYHDKVYEPEKLVGEQKELEEEFRSVLAEFGESFAKPYGWAAHNLCKNHPRFRDLEEAVDWGALPPDYKWSSHKIHAGAAGTIRTLGSIGGEQFIHAGAVNAGLDIPAINTAYSLMQITSLVFGKLSDLEAQIRMQSLVVLRDRVVNECRKAARKLERDHLEFLSEQ